MTDGNGLTSITARALGTGIFDDAELDSEILGKLLELGIGKSVTNHSQLESENIAEVIGNHRLLDTRWQRRAHVVDFAPQLVPYLRQLVRPVRILDFNPYQRFAGARPGLDIIQLRQLLERRRIRSVASTRRCWAPGPRCPCCAS